MSQAFDTRLAEWREQIDKELSELINGSDYPRDFKDVLNYAVFPGGKRLRAVLFLEWHSLYAPPDQNALRYACALELMHCYSLIHDDMPCADNDDFRRGKPSVHKAFGEGKALLAGDALCDMSYNAMNDACYESRRFKSSDAFFIRGDRGMVCGQYLDLFGKCDSLEKLLDMYDKKTGALIASSCAAGYLFSQDVNASVYLDAFLRVGGLARFDEYAAESKIRAAYMFGKYFGRAFQLYDDLSEYLAGETSDGTHILDFLDLDKAKKMLLECIDSAVKELDNDFNGDTSFLRELAEKFVIV